MPGQNDFRTRQNQTFPEQIFIVPYQKICVPNKKCPWLKSPCLVLKRMKDDFLAMYSSLSNKRAARSY